MDSLKPLEMPSQSWDAWRDMWIESVDEQEPEYPIDRQENIDIHRKSSQELIASSQHVDIGKQVLEETITIYGIPYAGDEQPTVITKRHISSEWVNRPA